MPDEDLDRPRDDGCRFSGEGSWHVNGTDRIIGNGHVTPP
jgi:hypothetical protein